MSNAIGLNVQTALAIDVAPVDVVSTKQGCDGECSALNGGFLELINIELEALVDAESPDLESSFLALLDLKSPNDSAGLELSGLKALELMALSDSESLEKIEEVEELDDISNTILANLLQGDEKPTEVLSLVDAPILVETSALEDVDINIQKLEAEFKQALTELPEDIVALPLTPENKMIIQEQALALVQQKNPELMAKIQIENGQTLSLEGKLLPLVDEALVNPGSIKSVQIASISASSFANELINKELGVTTHAEKIPLELSSKDNFEHELDDGFKNVFEQSDKNSDVIRDKITINPVQVEAQPQKLTTETLSTTFNNVLGSHQTAVSTPTAIAVQSGTTLVLPQNSSPEQWGSALGDKVQWMINTKMESAEIRIDPPHLGKMDVSIKMTDDGAHVVIQTQHAATRDLVDAASYRLKEMLEQAGYENVNVDVSQKESNQSDSQMAQDEGHGDTQTAINDGNQESLTASTEDILAGSFSERPGLDLFV